MKPLSFQDLTLGSTEHDYVILAGPTAVGKTDSLLELAELADIEVISGDSRQVYRYMDIGTATPSEALRQQIPHHLINELDPDVVWDAADFYQRARELVRAIIRRGKLPVVVGGAGMYLDALRDGLFDEQAKDPVLRAKYQALVDAGCAESLWQELLQIDPEYAQTFHHNNHKKLMRAYEIYKSTGQVPSKLFRESTDPFELKDLYVVLDRPRPILYERINSRVVQMLDEGLIGECEALLQRGYSEDLYPLKTIGYKEVFAFLKGELTQDEMLALIQKNTRNFSKRQLTWFSNHTFDNRITIHSD